MNEEKVSSLHHVHGKDDPNRRLDVVFVHGLNGDAMRTWHRENQPETFWPKWLAEEVAGVAVWSLGYPVAASGWAGTTMYLADRAINVLDVLNVELKTDLPIVFVAHSLGGLLVKEMLRNAFNSRAPESRSLLNRTRGVVFLSTPHSGSNLANFAAYLKFALPSVSIEELKTDEPRLRELNTWYRNNAKALGIATKVYCERLTTAIASNNPLNRLLRVMVVDASSADPELENVPAVPVDYDHIGISHPAKHSHLFEGVAKFVRELLPPEAARPDVEGAVKKLRKLVGESIRQRCGSMKVLDMTQSVDLDTLYTDVNVLQKPTSLRPASLLREPTAEDFDRWGLNPVQEGRVPALEVAERHGKLLLLGKPGAGKTTFLKRLAVLCDAGRFIPDKVPVFLSLRDFADAQGGPGLEEYLCGGARGVQHLPDAGAGLLLQQGRVLLLLDGLDEVRQEHSKRVQGEVEAFVERHGLNTFVMSCRLATERLNFQQFTEVEVCDFDDEQIARFAEKWFNGPDKDPGKAGTFLEKLARRPRVRELATNPLLLTLLCLFFEDSADFPEERAKLYKEALDVLLKKWDGRRGIERDQAYRKLSLRRKEELLGRLAWESFERSNYFFEKKRAVDLVVGYLRSLPEAAEDPEELELDSEAVLQSIGAQHGLVVKRARDIYSFSHLTFHEYFAAKRAIGLGEAGVAALVGRVAEPRWREVLLLAAGMAESADTLLLEMKRWIDAKAASDVQLQDFLRWAAGEALLEGGPYKPAAVRVLRTHAGLALAPDIGFDIGLDLDLPLYLVRALDVALHRARARARALALDLDLDRADLDRSRAFDLAFDRSRAFDLAFDLALTQDLIGAQILTPGQASPVRFPIELEQLLAEPSMDPVGKPFRWFEQSFPGWCDRLLQLRPRLPDLAEAAALSGIAADACERIKELRWYFQSNALLVQCMNSGCPVSPAARDWIEKTLLLPGELIEPYLEPGVHRQDVNL